MNGDAPSNRSIDELFARARSARIVTVEMGSRGRLVARLEQDELPVLRRALSIKESEERFHCMCLGTLAVQLRGRFRTVGTITYHHGVSVRFSDWCSDAWLEDGAALATLLAARGIEEPLRELERDRHMQREANDARSVWMAAVPRALSASLATLEVDGMGLPKRPSAQELETVLAALAGEDGEPKAVATALFGWLAAGRGPWSGYASYEELPMQILRAMPHEVVIAAALELDDRALPAAARHFASHEVVSFQKRKLADVPEELFERARPLVAASGVLDDLHRFEHAVRVAKEAREARKPRAPWTQGGLVYVGQSQDGPLSGLAAIGDALFSCDVRTLVRFDPGDVGPRMLAEASEHFVVLAAGTRFFYATINGGDVFAHDGERAIRIAQAQPCPVEIAAHGEHVAWINRDAPGGRAIVVAHGGELTTLEERAATAWALALGPTHAYWVDQGFVDAGEIRRAPLEGGAVETFARIPKLGPSMGTPRLVFSEGELLVALGDRVLAFDAAGGKRTIVESKKPIWALAADAQHIALVIGKDESDVPWSLAAAPRAGGSARILATFRRAPYHRHPLVIARGHACTTLADRVIAAPLDA